MIPALPDSLGRSKEDFERYDWRTVKVTLHKEVREPCVVVLPIGDKTETFTFERQVEWRAAVEVEQKPTVLRVMSKTGNDSDLFWRTFWLKGKFPTKREAKDKAMEWFRAIRKTHSLPTTWPLAGVPELRVA